MEKPSEFFNNLFSSRNSKFKFLRTNKAILMKSVSIMSAPAIVGMILFYYWPIFEAFRYSFLQYNLIARTSTFVGFDNFRDLLNDPLVFISFRVTFLFFLIKVPLQMASGLGLALLVRNNTKGIGLLRTIILLPTVTSMVVVTVVWGFMYHPSTGLFNSFLNAIGLPSQKFLTSPTQALPSIVVLTLWKDVGLTMLFYLAGLLGISTEFYEAAKIDGANGWQQFRFITVPALRRTHLFILVTSTISAFRVFDPVYLTTQGGPINATRVILILIYNNAFRFHRLGYASAITVVLVLILVVISGIQFYLTREKHSKPKIKRSTYKAKNVPYV